MVDDDSCFQIHTNIGCDEVAHIWSLYPGSQKCYDAFATTWDICTEFNEVAPPEDNDWDTTFDDPPMCPPLVDPSAARTAMDLVDDPPICSTLADPPAAHTAADSPFHAAMALVNNSPIPPTLVDPPAARTAADPSSHNAMVFIGDTIPVSDSPEILILVDILYNQYGFIDSPSQPPLPSSHFIVVLALKICEEKASYLDLASHCNVAAGFMTKLINNQLFVSGDDFHDHYNGGHIVVERHKGMKIGVSGNTTPGMFYLICSHVVTHHPFVICIEDALSVMRSEEHTSELQSQ